MEDATSRVLSDVVAVIDGYRSLQKRCQELEANTVNADRFYNWAVPVETVASMHGVSMYLVRKYIELGLIEKHPNSKTGKFFVRGSVAIMLDFNALREKAKLTK